MAKKRTMNEYRQNKEYKLDPVQQVLAQQIEEECPLDPVEEAKIEIADKVVKHLDDVIFEMVCEEMGKRHVFQSQNYLTEAGMDEFEEQFFEFYHEHHGDILAAIHNKLIY